jgi:hypothetical protein
MPQSLANVLVHVIFSTKNRARLIDPGIKANCTRTWHPSVGRAIHRHTPWAALKTMSTFP